MMRKVALQCLGNRPRYKRHLHALSHAKEGRGVRLRLLAVIPIHPQTLQFHLLVDDFGYRVSFGSRRSVRWRIQVQLLENDARTKGPVLARTVIFVSDVDAIDAQLEVVDDLRQQSSRGGRALLAVAFVLNSLLTFLDRLRNQPSRSLQPSTAHACSPSLGFPSCARRSAIPILGTRSRIPRPLAPWSASSPNSSTESIP